MEIQQILLTTDLSEHARRAYGCAANLASKFGATLHLVHFAGALPSFIPTASRETLLDTLEGTIVDEASEHAAFEGIEVQPHLQRHRWSRSGQRSLERELAIDLVVMSPQGRTGIAKILLGSFADRVVRHSSVPVLLFRRERGETLNPQTVYVPHDFYDRPRNVVPAMRWLDNNYHCSFRFLHVYNPSWANSQSVRRIEHHFVRALKASQTMSVEERFSKLVDEELHGLDVSLETAQEYPSQQVVQHANHLPADLILLGKREGLGSVARAVTREVKCSLLTIPTIDQEN